MRALDPDFVVFPTYKWLLGPYGRAFLYVAAATRAASRWSRPAPAAAPSRPSRTSTSRDTGYVADARRFDMAERDFFIAMEMASIGMEMMAEWGAPAVAERCAALTARLADGLRGNSVEFPDARVRAPHILSLGFPDGMPTGW